MKLQVLLVLSLAALLIVLTILFFRGGEGTLTITTYPVPGTVCVDGESIGEAPRTLTLKAGKYEVSYSPYSDQYDSPGTRIIQIKKGQQKSTVGIYRNKFLPAEPPAGFSREDSIRIYGTVERKLKDGTIFDYINGGALIYLRHGLIETTHAVYHDEDENTIVVDIFDMETTENAGAAFDDEEICQRGFKTDGLGEIYKIYNFKPEVLIYFHKSFYLVSLSINNDNLRKILQTFAQTIEQAIP